MLWFQLADRLHMSVQRCQTETTSTEFADWQKYQRQEMNIHGKLDYYLAQLAACIERTFSKDPRKITTEGKLIDFKWSKPEQVTEEGIEAYSEVAAAIWAARLSMIKPQPPPPQKE